MLRVLVLNINTSNNGSVDDRVSGGYSVDSSVVGVDDINNNGGGVDGGVGGDGGDEVMV